MTQPESTVRKDELDADCDGGCGYKNDDHNGATMVLC